MRSILTLALKDLRLLWRDRFGMFWVLVFPLLQALFFGAIFGGDSRNTAKMSIGVIDEDHTPASRAFIDRLRASSALDVMPTLDKSGHPAAELTIDQARNKVRRGELVALVIVKKRDGDSGNFMLAEMPQLEVGIDPSRKAEAGYLQGILTEASFRGMQEMFNDPAKMRPRIERARKDLQNDSDLPGAQRIVLSMFLGSLDQFLGSIDPNVYRNGGMTLDSAATIKQIDIARTADGPQSSYEITFPSAMLWGVIGCTAGFAISLVTERRSGTLLRLRVAPIRRAQILAGKALACFLACVGVIALLLAIGQIPIFGVHVRQPFLLAMAAVSVAVCFVGLTMLFATLGSTESGVAGVSWAVMLISAMLGGGMIPLIAMPAWMLRVSNLSPVKWGIYSLEGAIWRDFSPAEMLKPCAILLAIGCVGFAIGVRLLRRREAR